MITLLCIGIVIFISLGAILWTIYDYNQSTKELRKNIDDCEKRIALLKMLYYTMDKIVKFEENKEDESV